MRKALLEPECTEHSSASPVSFPLLKQNCLSTAAAALRCEESECCELCIHSWNLFLLFCLSENMLPFDDLHTVISCTIVF